MIDAAATPGTPQMATVGNAGWRVEFHESAASTNDLASGHPGWSAVVAERQTHARGRFGRDYQSASGGLWLSAVVPAPGGARQWNGFSLAVGLTLAAALGGLGVPGARLRWPNDLMAGHRKLGGLLIEQNAIETMTVGFGLNVWNRPWESERSLETSATRLADLLDPCPDTADCLALCLDAIAEAHALLADMGLAGVIRALNPLWWSESVRLDLHDNRTLTGRFLGLDPDGHLRIETAREIVIVPHTTVLRLTET